VLDDFYPNDIDVKYLYGYTRVELLPGHHAVLELPRRGDPTR